MEVDNFVKCRKAHLGHGFVEISHAIVTKGLLTKCNEKFLWPKGFTPMHMNSLANRSVIWCQG